MFDLHEKYKYEQHVKVFSFKSKLKKNICFSKTELNANSYKNHIIKQHQKFCFLMQVCLQAHAIL